MKKHVIGGYILLAAVSALSLTACNKGNAADALAGASGQAGHVITVQSSDVEKVVPDMAEIEFGVTTQEESPEKCQQKNNQELDAVIKFLKDSGIADTSIQTASLGLNPTYSDSPGRNITGYQMDATIVVSDLPIDQAGTVISSSVSAGINSISRVSYLSSKYDETYQQALKNAIAAAKKKAKAIADESGCALGPVVHVEEYPNNSTPRYTGYQNMSAADSSSARAMNIQPGQLSINAQISVDFQIK